jgi:lipopolysaccharide export system protein LptA
MLMTSIISKNLNRFNNRNFVLRVLAVFAAFFAGVFFSRASNSSVPSNQITPKKPVNISSSQLTFDKLKGLTLFKGRVKALHGTVILTADEIRAFSENNAATAKGHVKVVDKTQGVTLTCGNLEYQDQMEVMTAHDHPILTSVDNNKKPVTILGRQMELDSNAKTVVINQNVQIIQAASNAEAQKATFLANEDKLILENDPRVYTSSAQITARRITTNMGEEKSFFAEGLADALFNPTGEPLTVKSKTDDKKPAAAGVKNGSSNGKGSNGPVTSGTPGAQPTVMMTPGTVSTPSDSSTQIQTPGSLGR